MKIFILLYSLFSLYSYIHMKFFIIFILIILPLILKYDIIKLDQSCVLYIPFKKRCYNFDIHVF